MNFSNKKLFFASAAIVSSLLSFATGEAANRKAHPVEALSADAYIWGYPAVLMKQTRDAMIEKSNPRESLNHLFPTTEPQERFLKELIPLNSEHLHSWAWLDLSEEPLLISQPSTSSRYYSIQLVDAFANVFQVISNQTLRGKPSTFAITSPTWKGQLPSGVVRIKATTPEVFVLAQTSADKRDPKMQFVTLSNWNKGQRTPSSRTGPAESPRTLAKNLAPLGQQFLTDLFAVTQKNLPPTGADQKQLQTFSQSLAQGQLNAESRAAMERGLFAGARKIEDRIAEGFGSKVNGWSYELKAEPFREDYLLRAAVAQSTLFSTPAKEFLHLKAVTDTEDRQLYGDYSYTIHFNKEELPPTPTGWTLRVLDSNSQEKSRLNDHQAKLKYNKDGSLDIHLQADPPDSKELIANWLPLDKESGFTVVLTIYNPVGSVINRQFVAPAIARDEAEGIKRPKIVRTMMAWSNVSKRDIAPSQIVTAK